MIAHIILFVASAALALASWRHWHVLPVPFSADGGLRLLLIAGFSGMALWQIPCAWWAWRRARRKSRPILRLGGFA